MAKRLLLLEDEPTLARAMARLLRRAEYDVFLAGSCDEARKTSGTFSLGVFDIDLPDGDGIDLARDMLTTGAIRRVVFFSGCMNPVQRARAARLGPFVEKVSGFPALRATIELALASQRERVSGGEDAPPEQSSDPPPSGIRGNGGQSIH